VVFTVVGGRAFSFCSFSLFYFLTSFFPSVIYSCGSLCTLVLWTHFFFFDLSWWLRWIAYKRATAVFFVRFNSLFTINLFSGAWVAHWYITVKHAFRQITSVVSIWYFVYGDVLYAASELLNGRLCIFTLRSLLHTGGPICRVRSQSDGTYVRG